MPALDVRIVIMADLRIRCGHYIFILPFFFFPRHFIFALLFRLSSFFFLLA